MALRRTRAARWLLGSLLVGTALFIPSPVLAEACTEGMPHEVRNIRGYTFAGTYAERGPGSDIESPTLVFEVDTVYAGAELPPSEDFGNRLVEGERMVFFDGCAPVPADKLAIGQRYLVSKRTLVGFTGTETAIWRIAQGGSVELVRFYGGQGLNPRVAEPRTLHEALVLVGALSLPPTDVKPSPPSMPIEPAALVAILAASFAIAVGGIRSRARR